MLYRKVEQEDGTIEYVEVDETEVVKSNELYLKTKKEAIQNRQKVKELKKEEGVTPTPAETPSAPPLDVDALYFTFKQRLESERTQAEREREDRKRTLTGLLETHKLPTELLEVLETSSDPASAAAALAKARLRFDEGVANPDTQTDVSGVMAQVYKSLNIS